MKKKEIISADKKKETISADKKKANKFSWQKEKNSFSQQKLRWKNLTWVIAGLPPQIDPEWSLMSYLT